MKALPTVCLLFSLMSLALPAAEKTAEDKAAEPRQRNAKESEYQQRTFKAAAGDELPYGWLAPLQIKEGEKYPLVICLHGSGGNVTASGVLAETEMRQKYPAFVMVPRTQRPFAWAKTDALQRKGRPAYTSEKLPTLIEAVRSLMQTEVIDPARVYITGQSLGGVGSWGAIAQHPGLFAAAVPVCGAWKVEDAPKMAPVPIWAFHGAKDATVPVSFSRELTAAVNQAGGAAKYTEYPEVGHASWLNAYQDPEMWKWLFAQRKAAAP